MNTETVTEVEATATPAHQTTDPWPTSDFELGLQIGEGAGRLRFYFKDPRKLLTAEGLTTRALCEAFLERLKAALDEAEKASCPAAHTTAQ